MFVESNKTVRLEFYIFASFLFYFSSILVLLYVYKRISLLWPGQFVKPLILQHRYLGAMLDYQGIFIHLIP